MYCFDSESSLEWLEDQLVFYVYIFLSFLFLSFPLSSCSLSSFSFSPTPHPKTHRIKSRLAVVNTFKLSACRFMSSSPTRSIAKICWEESMLEYDPEPSPALVPEPPPPLLSKEDEERPRLEDAIEELLLPLAGSAAGVLALVSPSPASRSLWFWLFDREARATAEKRLAALRDLRTFPHRDDDLRLVDDFVGCISRLVLRLLEVEEVDGGGWALMRGWGESFGISLLEKGDKRTGTKLWRRPRSRWRASSRHHSLTASPNSPTHASCSTAEAVAAAANTAAGEVLSFPPFSPPSVYSLPGLSARPSSVPVDSVADSFRT